MKIEIFFEISKIGNVFKGCYFDVKQKKIWPLILRVLFFTILWVRTTSKHLNKVFMLPISSEKNNPLCLKVICE